MRSEKNTGQKVLKERIKGNNIRHETVGHMDSFTENKSIVNAGKKEYQFKEYFFDSRLLLYFNFFWYHPNLA